MVKFIIICALVSGCTTTRYFSAPLPTLQKLERPVLETEALKQGDSPDVVVRAHRLAIKQLQEYAMKLELLLNAYRR